MKFIKSYWFGVLIGLWMFLFITMVVLVLVAPHHDAKNRGFAFCTQDLVDGLAQCNNSSLCGLKAILKNTWCDVAIIAKGCGDWIKGEQPYPWSNYIFEPELKQNSYVDDAEVKEYLEQYPDTIAEMERLKQIRKDMEHAQNSEISDEKFSFQEQPAGMGLE